MISNIGMDRICAFDVSFFDTDATTAFSLTHTPIKKDTSVYLDKPWETEGAFPNIVYSDGIYRMYYMAGARINMERISKVDPGDKDALQKIVDETIADGFKICCMESKDGIRWTKPSYGICEFKGNTDNNIILKKPVEFFVMKDTNPDCRIGEEYKAVYHESHRLYCMFSSDGLHFREGGLISEYGGLYDTLNTVHFNQRTGKYVAFVRGFHSPDGGEFPDFDDKAEMKRMMFPQYDSYEEETRLSPRRDIRVMYSDDFVTWTRPKRIHFQDEDDLTQYYTNGISIYPRAPRYYIGFPMRYQQNTCWDERIEALCGCDARKFRSLLSLRYGLAVTDGAFMASLDGEKWMKADETFLRPGRERTDGWLYGDCCLSPEMIETKDEYGNTELSLYCVEGIWGHRCRLVRYTLRPDGFRSYHAGIKPKEIRTKPFIFEGNHLEMNLSTSAGGYVQVMLEDKNGNQRFSRKIFGDSTEKIIFFDEKNDISVLQKKEVTMTIFLSDADVYSFRFF